MKHIDYYKNLVMGNKASGGGGGITPTGTLPIEIVENGVTEHDVTQYAKAKVTVDVPEPSGEKVIDIVANGTTTEDIKDFATAKINVNVPGENPPSGTKEISITENGNTQHDVAGFATADITVAVPEPAGRLDIVENGVKDVKQYAEVNVQVPQTGITPSGTKEIAVKSNGQVTEDVTEYANVHITTEVPLPTEEKSVTYTENKSVDEDVSALGTLHVTVQVPEPTGEKTIQITQNGETVEDVKDFANARINVQVPTSGGGRAYLDELITRTLTDLNDDTLTEIGMYAFARSDKLKTINLQNVTKVEESAFRYCNALTSIELPNAETIEAYAFQAYIGADVDLPQLQSVHFPKVKALSNYVLANNFGIEKIKCESAMSVEENSLPTSAPLAKLRTLDIYGGGTFKANIANVETITIIFRNEDNITTLDGRAKFPSDFSLYVPDSILEQYKTSTNWSKYADKIKPLSEYVEV